MLRSPDFQPYYITRNSTPITHLAYADDVIVFSSGERRTLKKIMKTIEEYEEISGQRVNKEKSGFILGAKHARSHRDRIAQITGFCYNPLPIKYLGCPLYEGRKSKKYFDNLVDAISMKIQGWSKKWLSTGGRIVLIKSVLYSMPIHLLTVIQPPKGIIKTIEKMLSDFLWGNSEEGKRYHWRK